MSHSLHTDRGRAALLLVAIAGLASVLHGESRRAILVGIDNYNPDPAYQAQLLRDLKPPVVKRPTVEGDARYWRFDNLDGAVADVNLMKAVLEGLGFQDFVVLTDQDATADAILQALRKNLVDDAQPGDFRLFYYAGHGNHIKNLASTKQQREDQTLVPADNWRNVPDIRDKEISRILFAAARKGVIVTFIADSCYSGSLSRGAWNSGGKPRTNSGTRATPGVTLHEPVANDPADTDPSTHRPIDPEALGVLTLAGAQPNQEVLEVPTEDGQHGAFTWAFAQALRYASEPADRIFARTMASLGSDGALQQPAMGGAARFSKTIFGQAPAAGGGLTVVVDSVKGADIHLRGGTAIGLFPKCRLKTASQPAVTVEIASSEGLSGSIAHVAGRGSVKPGDVLTLDRWVVPAKAGLRVSIPKPAPEAVVARAVAEFGKLRGDPAVGWLDDPTAAMPTDVVSWNGAAWILEASPATAKPVTLGTQPAAADIKRQLSPKPRLLVRLPPTTSLLPAIPLGDADHSAVEIATSNAGAQYCFWGKIADTGPVYAWLLPDSTEASVRDAAAQTNRASGYLPLPIRSDWVKLPQDAEGVRAAGADLTNKALLLARIRAWLTLQSPPSQENFPYHLAFRQIVDGKLGEFKDAGDFKEGEQYKLYLRADPAALAAGASLAPRWVYVFVIDHLGNGNSIFPAPNRGNEGNRLPYAQVGNKPDFQPLIPLAGDSPNEDFSIDAPFGVDTYFLLTSDNAIDNPEVFNFVGPRTETGTRGASDPLTDLLSSTSSMTRGVNLRAIPALWSIETQTHPSVPKDANK